MVAVAAMYWGMAGLPAVMAAAESRLKRYAELLPSMDS